MKNNNQQNHETNARTPNNVRTNAAASQSGGKRPENKDNLDSREGEEQDDKGGDVTHNTKEHKSAGKSK